MALAGLALLAIFLTPLVDDAGAGQTARPALTPSAAPPRIAPTSAAGAAEAALTTPTPAPVGRFSSQQVARVNALMSRMTIDQKAGQVFLVFFRGAAVSRELVAMIRDQSIGGLVLFNITGNLQTLPQAASLIAGAQAQAVASGAGVALFVAVDQEGGDVTRLPAGATRFPSNMALGATGSTEHARRVAEITARELRAVGVNMNLAPVLDVNDNADNPVIGVRSFGSSPDLVAKLGVAMLGAYRDEGIVAVAKHFPGHGGTADDSHLVLPVVRRDEAGLWATELAPFRAAIQAGLDAVMTAHVVFPAFESDETLPATLSSKVLGGLLRDRLAYDGLIVSDSITMNAIDGNREPLDAVLAAFRAGVDVIAFGADRNRSTALQRDVISRFAEAVRADPALKARLDESVRRILLVKADYGILDWQPSQAVDPRAVAGVAAHLDEARAVARDSVTLVKVTAALLPLPEDSRPLLVLPRGVGDLAAPLRACRSSLRTVQVARDPTAGDVARVNRAAASASVIIVASADARRYPGQQRLIQALLPDFSGRLIVAAVWSPYDLMAFPSVGTYVATYGDTPESLAALAAVLCGMDKARGRLPVELPGLFPAGHGI